MEKPNKDESVSITTAPKRPLKDISEYKNINDLRQIIKNAEKNNELEYAKQAEDQINFLIENISDDLKNDFQRVMDVYETHLSEKNKKKTRASYTWKSVKKNGIRQTLENLVGTDPVAFGYTTLAKSLKFDDTFEALVIKYPDEFSLKSINNAKNRKIEYQKFVEKLNKK